MVEEGRHWPDGGSELLGTGRMFSLGDALGIAGYHPVGLNGRCARCEVDGPCVLQSRALRSLAACDRLPQRRPGATRPELVGARRVMAGGRRG